jgi:DivIVA domain-containing protein
MPSATGECLSDAVAPPTGFLGYIPAMDTTTTNQSALDALRTAEFRLSLRGYDVDEVDDFLERAAVEADQLREQLRLATASVAQANDRARVAEDAKPTGTASAPAVAAPSTPATPGQSAGVVTKMIEMAERFVEQTRQDAETEAARLIAEAQDRVKQLASDSQQRLADEVARLEGLRQRLGEDVEKVSRQLETERTRLSGSLRELLGWIDKNLQPAAGLATLRAASDEPNESPKVHANAGAQVLNLDDARHEES